MKDYLEKQDTFDEGAFIVADGAYSGETEKIGFFMEKLKLQGRCDAVRYH